MRQILIVLHPVVPNFQHVGIVPMPGSGKCAQSILGEADYRHAVVVVTDVAGSAPQVAGARSPCPWSFNAPIADTEDDLPPRLCDRVPKFCILHNWLNPFAVSPIDF